MSPRTLAGMPLDRVAIVMLSAVGDSVHVLPVVTALRRHRPDMHLTWMIQRGPLSLVEGHPSVSEFVTVEPTAAGLARYRREMRDRSFDLVIDLQVALKGGLVTALTPARAKLGFDRARARDLNWLFTTHRIPPHPRQHVQDQYFEFLDALSVPHEPVTWQLGPRPDERPWQREFLSRFDRPIAAVVCGTSSPDRDWLPERWAAVCDALDADYGLQPVLVGGPSDRERATAAEVRRLARHSAPVDALGSGLRKLVSILDGSALVLSLDTAPLHISVALDRPVVSLMSQADPKRTGPYRRFRDLVVNAFAEPGDDPDVVIWERRRGRMGRITVEDVLAKVEHWRSAYV
ncbi:MAG TPA: glycosyltransferase family 9 protein [Gemmatimonadaceae bacterium]|nr:glycosyltransferase family 9 protein [Gemmatimonadaceae bacterium]